MSDTDSDHDSAQEQDGWQPSTNDLAWAKRFGNLRYGTKAYDYRGGKSHGQAYDSKFGDSVNQLGYLFGEESPEDLLPANYLSGKVRRSGTTRPLATQERYPAGELQQLSPEQQELANRYTKALKNFSAPNAQYVLGMGIPREEHAPLSLAERREQAQKTRLAREAALNAEFPQVSDRIAAENLVRRQRKIKSYEREMGEKKYFDPVSGSTKDVDESYRMQKRALQNIARSLQGSIAEPQYARYLSQTAIRGRDPDTLGADDLQEFKDMRGYSIQTLPPDERDQLMINLYKIIGILNATPVYDGRLTTVASASQVYNPKDYVIYTVNADDNVLTPGITVVRTRNDSTNSRGQYVPAGSYVSIGGWTLADASQGRSLQRLKNMMYYQNFPTRKLRSQSKLSDFTGALFGTRKDIKGDVGLKRISQMLRSIYQLGGYFIPQRVRSEKGPFMDVPTYMQLSAQKYPNLDAYNIRIDEAQAVGHNSATDDANWKGTEGWTNTPDNPNGEQENLIYATIKLSTPVFNTWLSWVAKLFFNMVMLTDPTCPFKLQSENPTIQKWIKESVAVNALAHGIVGQEITNINYTPDESKRRYNVTFADDGGINYGPAKENWGPLPDATTQQGLVQIHELWSKSYFDDTALNLILRDDYVLRWIKLYCENLEASISGADDGENPQNQQDTQANRTYYLNLLKNLGHVILYYTMNSSLPDYLDDIVHESVTAANYNTMYRRYVYAYSANIQFLNADKCKELVSRELTGETYTYDAFKVNKFHNVTKKLWANVVAECGLSRRCYTWVGKSFTTDPNTRVLMPSTEDYDVKPEDDGTALAQLFHTTAAPIEEEFTLPPTRTTRASRQDEINASNPYTRNARLSREEEMARLIDTLAGPAPAATAAAATATPTPTTTTTTTTTTAAAAPAAAPPIATRPTTRRKRRTAEDLAREEAERILGRP